MEVNYVQCSLLKSFREDARKKTSVEIVQKMKNYIERVSDKIERFTRGNATKDQNKNTSIFSHPREKVTNDLFTDFYNLFQLQGIQTICNSHSELIKAYKSKIDNLKQEVQTMADRRRAIIRDEQRQFIEAKQKGVRALINYKLSKQKFKNQMTQVEKQFAQDFRKYATQVEEEVAFNKLKQMEESKRNVGYMHVSNYASKSTQIIGAGMNLEYSKQQIDNLTKMQNILNQLETRLNPKDHDIASGLVYQYIDIAHKVAHAWDLADFESIAQPSTQESKKKQQVGYQHTMIRMKMKHWKLQKSMNANKLYSS
jgi:hypothetical protein